MAFLTKRWLFTGCLLLMGCAQNYSSTVEESADLPVIDIVAEGMQFVAPSTVNAGWATWRFHNRSSVVHFALIQKLPPGIGIADHQREVAPLFQQIMDGLNEGNNETVNQAVKALPDWFHSVKYVGGPGFITAGETALTSLYLEPGQYLVECYVKTGGRFHSFRPDPQEYGMVAQVEVIASGSTAHAPTPTQRIEISSTDGIRLLDKASPGAQIVEVHFVNQEFQEHFLGHDVHLAKLDENSDLDKIETWMDWRTREGLESPAPVQFLGGTNEMPAGSKAYIHLNLSEGQYIWIAEVPEARKQRMLLPFRLE